MSYIEALRRTIARDKALRHAARGSEERRELTRKIRECERELRNVEERRAAERTYAEYDASMGYDLDSWGNSLHDYS